MIDNPIIRIGASVVVGLIIITIILSVMPVIAMPPALLDAISWMFNTLWSFDFAIPVQTLMQVAGMVFLTEILIATIKIILFLKKLFIHGSEN